MRVRHLLKDDEAFLANYSDGLTDLPLDQYLSRAKASGAVASLVAVRPSQSFHAVSCGDDGLVTGIHDVGQSDYWINAGFFFLRQEIFDHMRDGEELVLEPFSRLIEQRRLFAYKHTGFWAAMDTFKDKIRLDRMEARGECPWMVWDKPAKGAT